MKKILGTLSPAYGMATGHGLFGKNVGILPAIAKNYRDDKDKEKEAEAAAASGMKKGGMVSASKRADGCVKRGKTRGKMV
jgi:hypothetical protein